MSRDEISVSNLLEQIDRDFNSRPFVPQRTVTQGDAQTIAVHLWPGRVSVRENTRDQARLFQVAPGSQVLAYCRWHANRLEHATLVMWNGMEGSTASAYMLTTADKAFRAGFNVVRVNFRNCGGTEHLSPTLYHGGLTEDLRVVIDELIARDGLAQILIAGFSLGGNMVLKLAGEYGHSPPPEVKAVGAVSPSINLRASTDLMARRRNWIYQQDFLRRLRQRIRVKEKLFPDLYDAPSLRRLRTIDQFANRSIAPFFSFQHANAS